MKCRIIPIVLSLGVMSCLPDHSLAYQQDNPPPKKDGDPPRKKDGDPQPVQDGGFGWGKLQLLDLSDVQKELGLNSDQISRVGSLVRNVREKNQGNFAKFQDLDAKERREKMAELGRKMNNETDRALADIFKPEQMKRFHQIQRQQMGLLAFTEPEVQSKLKLTDSQISQIWRIAAGSQADMRDTFQGMGGNREAAMSMMATFRKEGMDKALAVLSADQKEAWKELTGEPFELSPQGRRRN